MIRHILKIIWTQKAANAWIFAEIALVAIFIWFITDTLLVFMKTYTSPTGFNVEHTYRLTVRAVSDESPQYIPKENLTTSTTDDLFTLVDRIRAYPGVEAVCLSDGGYPYNNSMSYSSLFRDTVESSMALRRRVTPDFFKVFKVTTPNGTVEPLVEGLGTNGIIISEDIAARLYPEGNPVGKDIVFTMEDTLPKRVGGVSIMTRSDDFRPLYSSFFFLMREDWLQQNLVELALPYIEICLRVSPDRDGKDFTDNFRKMMGSQLRYNNLYLLDIEPFWNIREKYIRDRVNDFKMYGSIIAFLLANIFLGVVGTFWFRTQQRRNEMGLRIALGSTRFGLGGLLVGEGLLLLVAAFLPAMVVSLNIGLNGIVNTGLGPFTAVRFITGQAITFAMLAIMIVAGIYIPAYRTAKLSPVEALHYE